MMATGNWTQAGNINPGDRVEIGGVMTGIIDTVYNINGITTLKIKDYVIFSGPSDTPVLGFFAEKNRDSFFFRR